MTQIRSDTCLPEEASESLERCTECRTLVRVDASARVCPVCGETFLDTQSIRRRSRVARFSAWVGFLLFFPAIFLPLISIDQLGPRYTTSLVAGLEELSLKGQTFLAAFTAVLAVALPLLALVSIVLSMSKSIQGVRLLRPFFRGMVSIAKLARDWVLIEIVVLALLVTLFKSGPVTIVLGAGAVFYGLMAFFCIFALINFDTRGLRAAEAGIAQSRILNEGESFDRCSLCDSLAVVISDVPCSCHHCGKRFPGANWKRYAGYLSRGFVYLGLLLLIPALSMPLLRITTVGKTVSVGVIEGSLLLASHGDYALAIVIATFSGLFPAVKLFAYLFILDRPYPASRFWRGVFRRVSKGVRWLGKWGLLDVMVVILSLMIYRGGPVRVTAEPGVFIFCAMAACTMLALHFHSISPSQSRKDVKHV